LGFVVVLSIVTGMMFSGWC